MKTILSLVVALVTVVALPSRAASLTTTFVTGGHINDEGMMFDIVAQTKMTITGIQVSYEENPLVSKVDIFTKSGTFVGSETTAANWSLNTSVAALAVAATATASPLVSLATPVTLNAGDRLGLYVVRDDGSGPNIAATAATTVGQPAAFNGDLLILQGSEISGLFNAIGGTVITPNVTIHYSLRDDAPNISLIGKSRIISSNRREAIQGIATDDKKGVSVTAQYRKVLPGGGKRTIVKALTPEANGLFKLSLKTQPGRTKVTFQAFDSSGNASSTVSATVIGS